MPANSTEWSSGIRWFFLSYSKCWAGRDFHFTLTNVQVSHVDCVTKEEAFDFVDDDATQSWELRLASHSYSSLVKPVNLWIRCSNPVLGVEATQKEWYGLELFCFESRQIVLTIPVPATHFVNNLDVLRLYDIEHCQACVCTIIDIISSCFTSFRSTVWYTIKCIFLAWVWWDSLNCVVRNIYS